MNDCTKQTYKTVKLLREKGIRLLAIDFDKTLISFHTRGMWTGGISELAKGIRPFLAHLIDLCLETENIFVAIVTFSTQRDLIWSVMESTFKNYSDLYIQTLLSRSDFRRNLPGKEGHLVSVVKCIQQQHGINLRPEEVFLVDDDSTNVATALKFNHRAILFDENTTTTSLNHYLASTYSTISSINHHQSYETSVVQTRSEPQLPTNRSHANPSSLGLSSAAYQVQASLYPVPLSRPVTLPFSNSKGPLN